MAGHARAAYTALLAGSASWGLRLHLPARHAIQGCPA
jgi:hypothetical protein